MLYRNSAETVNNSVLEWVQKHPLLVIYRGETIMENPNLVNDPEGYERAKELLDKIGIPEAGKEGFLFGLGLTILY